MPPDGCIVCGSKDPGVSLHCFPANKPRRAAWLRVFQLQESEVKSYTRVCCRHFPRGDVTQAPQTGLGKRFAAPKKKGTHRAKHANTREVTNYWSSLLESSAGHSRSATPLSKSPTPIPDACEPLLIASIGEPLESKYSVHELSTDSSEPSTSQVVSQGNAQVLVNEALLAQVEFLESEKQRLKGELKEVIEKPQDFHVEHIKHSDNLVRFSDLYMQSSTWSEYKHNNTGKFLIACTPNGAISFVSPLYVGSISDVELTRVSGFLTKLEDKPRVSNMTDGGFTIKDMLKDLGIDLSLPPVMEGRKQLPATEVQEGRSIAHLRIHVERAIGRIKKLQDSYQPISMARLANQIVCVCAFLSNFHPALVPIPTDPVENDVEEYFQCVSSNESD